jgi:nicotinamide-nucleotide amidase
VVATGEELVRGALADGNSAWLARRLRTVGFTVASIRAVGDGATAIERAVRESLAEAEVVVVGGGLGPTEDDRTRHALAAVAGVELSADEAASKMVAEWFRSRGRVASSSNARQSLLPAGALALRNPRGSAPGIELLIEGAVVFALPGVPLELRAMFDAEVIPKLRARHGGPAWQERLLQVAGLPESVVGERVARWMAGSGPPLVSDTVRYGVVTLCVSDSADADGTRRAEACIASMREALGDHCFAEGDVSLASHVVNRLRAATATLAVAESCTGGLVCAAISDVPGASEVLIEGAVTYRDEAKIRALGISRELIETHGAVSAEAARAMADGVRRVANARFGVATTGIAGPGGGSDATPVGTVHLAVAGPSGTRHVVRRYPGDREMVRQFATCGALDLLRRALD